MPRCTSVRTSPGHGHRVERSPVVARGQDRRPLSEPVPRIRRRDRRHPRRHTPASASMIGGYGRSRVRTSIRGSHAHLSYRSNWLRAAVLGANDGILSTASLVLGVAASGASGGAIVTAGIAGLVAGALSMAAGEYVSSAAARCRASRHPPGGARTSPRPGGRAARARGALRAAGTGAGAGERGRAEPVAPRRPGGTHPGRAWPGPRGALPGRSRPRGRRRCRSRRVPRCRCGRRGDAVNGRGPAPRWSSR